MQQREGVRKSLAVAIDDEMGSALRIEIDVLGAMAAGVAEAEAFDQSDEGLGFGVAGRELHELPRPSTVEAGGGGARSASGGVRARRPPRRQRLAARGAGARMPVDRDRRRRRRRGKLVVENLEGERGRGSLRASQASR